MLQKFVSLMLVVLLFCGGNSNFTYAAISNKERNSELAAKVKEGIKKLGIGEEARVEVRLRDKTSLKGYISETGAYSFIVVDAKTGEPTTIAYPAVKQIKGNNLNLGVKIAIGFAIFLLAIIVIASIRFAGSSDH